MRRNVCYSLHHAGISGLAPNPSPPGEGRCTQPSLFGETASEVESLTGEVLCVASLSGRRGIEGEAVNGKRINQFLKTLLLVITLSSMLFAQAQQKSNRGKEFWLGYGYDYKFLNEAPLNNQELAVYISAEQAANVTVSVNGTGWTQTLAIPANTADASILIPKSGPDDARVLTDGFSNKGIHIVSDVPVAAYAHVYGPQVSGATMLMPVETWGLSYYSINYFQTTSESNPPDWYSWFYVIATEDNTKVEITPSDTTKNGWLPGQTYTVTLNKGEMYHIFGKAGPFNTPNFALCSKDMTGSKAVSVTGTDGKCHPIAAFSGSSGIRLCKGDGGEYMQQQLFPSQAWGTRYLTYHTINNTNTDILQTNRNIYRICVQDPTTVVRRNGVVLTGLNKNFFYEYMDSTGGDYIEADKPIVVSQYMLNKNQCWNFPTTTPSPPSYGDPEMFYLSPIEQGQKSVLFYVSRKSTIDYVYANVFFPTAAVASLRVDGNVVPPSQIIPHPKLPSYSVAVVRFTGPAAQHTIACDSTFNATVYGLGNYESYGYNVGTFINNLNARTSIKNVFSSNAADSFTCVKTPFRMYVQLGYRASQIAWKLSGVANLSPAADSIINNPVPVDSAFVDGRRYYRYTLQQDFVFNAPGTYTVPFTYTATAIDACSKTESGNITVVVKAGPSADFNSSAARCLSDSIAFSGIANMAGFTLSQYLWTFSDATTATTLNTTKKFATAGAQPVRFQVIATNGCSGDTTKTITIDAAPLAKFGVNATACSQDSVLVSDSTTISSGNINAWRWDMGDGSILNKTSNALFRYSYASAGVYRIKLVTTSSNGCKSDTAYKDITVFEKPSASFTYDRNICVGDSVRFRDSSRLTQGSVASWQWSFGDGSNAAYTNGAPFYHPYATGGSFTVKLKVQSDKGCVDSTSQTVTVAAKPTAAIASSGVACVDSLRGFTSSFTGSNGAAWWWSFGDGQTGSSTTSNGVTHTYAAAANNLMVKHVVSIGQGCASDTATLTIPAINPNAMAAFRIVADTLCPGSLIAFAADTSGVASWNWSFGNGNGNSLPPFTRVYANAGNYTLSLTVKNRFGCGSSPFTQPLTIYPKPAINAGPDKFVKSGEQTRLDASIANPSNYRFWWTPSATLNNATVLNPIASPQATTEYTVQAIDTTSHCTATDKVTVTIYNGLYIPTGFTPNGDGTNDAWVIPGLALYPDALVTVFNRWGQVVYQTKDYISHPWNGKIAGEAVGSTTTFVYLIQLNDAQKQVLKGTVTIVR